MSMTTDAVEVPHCVCVAAAGPVSVVLCGAAVSVRALTEGVVTLQSSCGVWVLLLCLYVLTCCAMFTDQLWVLLPDCAMVLIAELFVDWVKHAFITRFNEIPADIYREYTLTLAYDLIASKQKYVRTFQQADDRLILTDFGIRAGCRSAES